MSTANLVFTVCPIADVPNRKGKALSLLRRGAEGEEHPLHVVILRWDRNIFAYVNSCPHQQTRLDWEPGEFTNPDGPHLMCGKHGALFSPDTGVCFSGPCQGGALEPLQVTVIEGDVCLLGLDLAEDE